MIVTMDTQKCAKSEDWHPADVKAALEKKGVSLRQLAKEHGYSHFQRVLTSTWWGAEQVVAAAIGVKPEEIWPSRYSKSRQKAKNRTVKVAVSKGGRVRRVMEEARA
jgi:Ner family transcriptional regulator